MIYFQLLTSRTQQTISLQRAVDAAAEISIPPPRSAVFPDGHFLTRILYTVLHKVTEMVLHVLPFLVFGFFLNVGSDSFPENVRVKRSDIDLQTCIDNFNVHRDKIIRTQDSQNMGAKYLNEIDLGSREECLRLCCETDNCDVFVFEEKVRIFGLLSTN